MTVPVFEFDGCDTAKMMNRVFAENVVDLLNKFEKGSPEFDRGFVHTSVIPHEGTCYHDYAWTRDAGRGIMEAARMGSTEKARDAIRFFMKNKNAGSHWRRLAAQRKSMQQDVAGNSCEFETDGDALVLLAFYNTWKYSGRDRALAEEILESAESVISWMQAQMAQCPVGRLVPSISELSGNPTFNARKVYAIYPNFHAWLAIGATAEVAGFHGRSDLEARYRTLAAELEAAMADRLVAGKILGKNGRPVTNVDEGCWINGIDENGLPFEHSVWGLTSFPIWHWTRQLPFIGYADLGMYSLPDDAFRTIHTRSYDFILKYMNQGAYFRKYGFVSNTGWTGTAGSHDDTMCGYGQGFMTQASLMMDDVNTYSKCIDGMMRLAYDGNVTENLSFEMNPWLLHECFSYGNYEQGLDHTYGCGSNGVNVHENPGDEGSLVQQAEPVKAMLMMAGVSSDRNGHLVLTPRMPWNFDRMTVTDIPYCTRDGVEFLSMELRHLRHRRRMNVQLRTTGTLDQASFRAGPFPMLTQPEDASLVKQVRGGAAWFVKTGLGGKETEFDIRLRQEID